jgi:uncharacterized protein YydD (DUF2326 family)
MILSKLYSNQAQLFAPICFNRGLSAVLAEIRLPENKKRDTHNLGKSTVGRLLDFMLLAGRDNKFFLFKHEDRFAAFVFFLELQIDSQSFVTVRRGVEEASKISLKLHSSPHQEFSDLPQSQWSHSKVPIDRAKEILDGVLDWRAMKPFEYRKGTGYLLRSQDDYRDVFQLGRFAGGHADWKPYLARLLGFDAGLVGRRYEKEEELKKKRALAQTLTGELGDGAKDVSKVDGLLLIKRQEAEKRQSLLDQFDLRTGDRQVTKQIVEEIGEQIADLNGKRYALAQGRKKIDVSLKEDAILFDPNDAARLFEEAGILFKGQIKKDYQQLIAFNRAITEERRQYLEAERDDIDKELKRISSELTKLGKQQADKLGYLTSTDSFARYKQASDELTTLKADILDLERQRGLLQRLATIRSEIRVLNDEVEQLGAQIEANINAQHQGDTLFSRIRLEFNAIVEEVIDRKAILSVSPNKEGHLEFKAEILDEAGNVTSADAGKTYKKLLCIAFDLAVLKCHMDQRFPRFVYHDGVFETLDPRKKVKLLSELRRLAGEGLQPIITLIDAELPPDDDEAKLSPEEIVLRLHDEGERGRLFRMPGW